jgi:hypothetical protein
MKAKLTVAWMSAIQFLLLGGALAASDDPMRLDSRIRPITQTLELKVDPAADTYSANGAVGGASKRRTAALADRNPQIFVPNIAYAKPEDLRKATHRVYRGGKWLSSISIGLLP